MHLLFAQSNHVGDEFGEALTPFFVIGASVLLIVVSVIYLRFVHYWREQKRHNPNSPVVRKGSKLLLIIVIMVFILAIASVIYRVVDSISDSRRRDKYEACIQEEFTPVDSCKKLLRQKWGF
jgi:peptidoglycan/LPS O-acetylase OafA/YrhL